MKKLLFHPDYTEVLYTCSGIGHTNNTAGLGKLKNDNRNIPAI